VELLYWDGCPSYTDALSQLRGAMEAEGLDPDAIEVRRVAGEAEAQREGFIGSPTIRVDGHDIVPSDDPPGLSCRVYRRRDGRYSPTPDPLDVREALR
jgi:hypothetical protein